MAVSSVLSVLTLREADIMLPAMHLCTVDDLNVKVAYSQKGDMYHGQTKKETDGITYLSGHCTCVRPGSFMFVGMVNKSFFVSGKLMFLDGTVYEGEFGGHKYHGQGSYQGVCDGVPFTYTGMFKDGKCNGFGTLTQPDVTTTGHFVKNQLNGVMTFVTKESTTTAVYMLGKQMNHPTGKFVPVDNGISSQGDFIEGDYITDDIVYSGQWNKFQLHNGVVTKNGKITNVFVHGVPKMFSDEQLKFVESC